MRKVFLLILTGLFGGSFSARADIASAKRLSLAQKQQIASAIRVLSESKAISQKQNQCVEFDPDLLRILQSEGHLQREWARPSVVCVSGER